MVLCGNGWPYRSGPELVALFNHHGFRDVYQAGFPSRTTFAKEKLTALSGKHEMAKLVCAIVDERLWFELQQETLTPQPECLNRLNELLAFDNHEVFKEGRVFKIRTLSGALIEAEAIPKDLPAATAATIEVQIRKCRAKIDAEDYDGAITNARSLIENLLLAIELELSAEPPQDFNGDLGKLFSRVRTLLNLESSRKDISESLKQVLSGLVSIVQGLAALRNKMSDSHGTSYRPSRHHAKLAVNCAMTLADFLFETKTYEATRGLLKGLAKPT